jgi:predicted transposase YdaD
LLCESQSTPDYFMSLRLKNYTSAIEARHFKQNPKSRKLPLIYPMVIYNGKKKHTAPRSLHEISEYPEIAKRLLFENYHLIDLSKFPDDALREKKWAGTMMFFMKHIFDSDFKALLRQKSDCLKELLLEKEGQDFLASILWYNKENILESEEEEIKNILVDITNKKAAKAIMGTLAEKYQREIMGTLAKKYQREMALSEKRGIALGQKKGIALGQKKGIALGQKKGIALGQKRGVTLGEKKGKLEAMRHVAKKMLTKETSIEEIKDLTGLTLTEILDLKNKK